MKIFHRRFLGLVVFSTTIASIIFYVKINPFSRLSANIRMSSILSNTKDRYKVNGIEGIWPRSDNETDNRMLNQIRFMKTYWPRKFKGVPRSNFNGAVFSKAMNPTMKVILRVGNTNFELYKDGRLCLHT